jgi:hypothetical protein
MVPLQSQLTTDNQDPLNCRYMQQLAKLNSLGVSQQNSLWVVMFLASLPIHFVMARRCGPTHRYWIAVGSALVFQCGGHLALSGSRKSCLLGFRWGMVAWHICSCCKAFPQLLLHSVVCTLSFHTSGSIGHFLTKAKSFHCQGMLDGILGDYSHWFVHGIKVAMSVELTLLFFSLRPFIYIHGFYWAIHSMS